MLQLYFFRISLLYKDFYLQYMAYNILPLDTPKNFYLSLLSSNPPLTSKDFEISVK